MTTLSLSPESRSTAPVVPEPAAVKPVRPDLKTELFAAASEAFPDGEVTVKVLGAGHQKLTARKLSPQFQVRVLLSAKTVEYKHVTVKDEGKDVVKLDRVPVTTTYAVCGLFPQDGNSSGIRAFIADLQSDAVRIAESFPK